MGSARNKKAWDPQENRIKCKQARQHRSKSKNKNNKHGNLSEANSQENRILIIPE